MVSARQIGQGLGIVGGARKGLGAALQQTAGPHDRNLQTGSDAHTL